MDSTAASLPRALVADDNPTNRLVAGGLMRKLGYRVDEVEDGAQAAELGGSGVYEVILMDLNMPIVDGFDAMRLIRDQEQWAGHPRSRIFAVTAWVTRESRQRANECGADRFLPKPLTVEALREAIEQTAPALRESGEAHPAPGTLEVAHLADIGGEELVQEALTTYLEHSRGLFERFDQVPPEDTREIGEIAHNLKGSSLAIGASDLARVAADLERRARSGDLEALSELRDELDQIARAVWQAAERRLG